MSVAGWYAAVESVCTPTTVHEPIEWHAIDAYETFGCGWLHDGSTGIVEWRTVPGTAAATAATESTSAHVRTSVAPRQPGRRTCRASYAAAPGSEA